MRVRKFGATDLRVSELGLGCARIGGIFQGDVRGFLNLLGCARDAGINFFDTADMYSQGESESLLGRAFRRERHQIVIASKAGYTLPTQRRLAARLKPFLRPVIRFLKLRRAAVPSSVRGAPSQDFEPAYLRRAIEGSLRRLRTDYLDIFQLHSPPAEVVARGEWVEALEGLKREGKIRYYGVAVDTVEAGLAALQFPGVSSLQFVVSLLEQGNVEALLPKARDKKVGVIAREILANGLLVKEESEISNWDTYVHSPEQKALRLRQLAEYRGQAAARHTTLPALAMGFPTSLDGVSVALLGARTMDQLRSLMRHAPREAEVRAS
jgi:aryl-alcohol dehydrogenase-like predicted oxidoreductase